MSTPRTPAQLAADADAFDDEAAKLELQAIALREQARLLREAASKAPLTIAKQRSIVRSKVEANVTGKDRYVRQAASRTRRTSEAKKMLLEAGQTDSKVATLLSVGRSTVNAYFSGRVAIPRAHAKTLLRLFSVPLALWPRILD